MFPPSDIRSDVIRVLKKLMEKEPEQRPATAAEAMNLLRSGIRRRSSTARNRAVQDRLPI